MPETAPALKMRSSGWFVLFRSISACSASASPGAIHQEKSSIVVSVDPPVPVGIDPPPESQPIAPSAPVINPVASNICHVFRFMFEAPLNRAVNGSSDYKL